MIIKYYNKCYPFNLNIDYTKLFKEGWLKPLKLLFQSKYMETVMFSTQECYKTERLITYPEKKDLFRIFQRIDLKDINVAIVNCSVKLNNRSNGLAFGNKINADEAYDHALVNIFAKVQNYDRSLLRKSDYTLEHWVKQNVFLYNCALTGSYQMLHIAKWLEFSKQILSLISKDRQGVVFLFIGTENEIEPYVSCINKQKHTILTSPTLTYESLNEINQEIDGINGKDYRIKW